MAIDPKAFRNSKASEYSSLSGTKKKGAKLKVKPNLKAEPKSNVKVIGKTDSSLKQRYPKTLTNSRPQASWEKEPKKKEVDKSPAKKTKLMDMIKRYPKGDGGASGMTAKRK